MFKINDSLATHGIDLLSGDPIPSTWFLVNAGVLKEADEVDANPLELYIDLIVETVLYLEVGNKVVICCSGGVSRSNAIAVGVLVYSCGMNYYDALALVQDKVPICQIEDIHTDALKKIFNVGRP